jgi:phosphinothricin acetyltransferase
MIRFATEADLPAILDIYGPYVLNTAISFEYSVPSPEEFTERFRSITAQFPWLVWEEDGIVLGYAYGSAPFSRAAYRWSGESSIYLSPQAQGKGIGKKLYTALEAILKAQGYRKTYAIVTSENDASLAFHQAVGFRVTAAMPQSLPLRWAALLHDIGKPDSRTESEDGQAHYHGHAQVSARMADEILLRLKAPTALREQAVLLVEKHMVWFELNKKMIRRWISRLGFERFDDLITLQNADCIATGTAGAEELAHFAEIRRLAKEILEEDACLSLKDLAVKGNDLIELGLQGRVIGENLNKLLTAVMEEEVPNEKAALLRRVREEML